MLGGIQGRLQMNDTFLQPEVVDVLFDTGFNDIRDVFGAAENDCEADARRYGIQVGNAALAKNSAEMRVDRNDIVTGFNHVAGYYVGRTFGLVRQPDDGHAPDLCQNI